jgi:hypothetical protein
MWSLLLAVLLVLLAHGDHPKTFADFAAASSSACFGSFIP